MHGNLAFIFFLWDTLFCEVYGVSASHLIHYEPYYEKINLLRVKNDYKGIYYQNRNKKTI